TEQPNALFAICRNNHESLRQREVVRDGEIDLRRVSRRRDFLQAFQRAAGELHARLAAGKIDDAHVAPEHTPPQPGAERFGTGFFRGEALCITCSTLRTLIRFVALELGKDAAEETLAEALDAFLDAADIDEIGADADDHCGRSRTKPGYSRATNALTS